MLRSIVTGLFIATENDAIDGFNLTDGNLCSTPYTRDNHEADSVKDAWHMRSQVIIRSRNALSSLMIQTARVQKRHHHLDVFLNTARGSTT